MLLPCRYADIAAAALMALIFYARCRRAQALRQDVCCRFRSALRDVYCRCDAATPRQRDAKPASCFVAAALLFSMSRRALLFAMFCLIAVVGATRILFSPRYAELLHAAASDANADTLYFSLITRHAACVSFTPPDVYFYFMPLMPPAAACLH